MTAVNKRRKSKVKRNGYRLALRSVPEWNDDDRMDDVVVKDVSVFRMEQMNDNDWWICCYLDDGPESDSITFHAHYDKKLQELIVKVTEHAGSDHVYESEVAQS